MTRRTLPHPGPESPDTYKLFIHTVNRSPKAKPPLPGIEQWTYNVLAGFARMERDPEYRRYIQSRVS